MDRCITRVDWIGKCDICADLVGSNREKKTKMVVGTPPSPVQKICQAVVYSSFRRSQEREVVVGSLMIEVHSGWRNAKLGLHGENMVG